MRTNSITLIVSILCLLSFMSFAQQDDFQGIATYKSNKTQTLVRFTDQKVDSSKQEVINKQNEMRKFTQELFNERNRQTYTLKFTKEESFYLREEKLMKPHPMQHKFDLVISYPPSKDVYYKNFKKNRYAQEVEIYGKEFLIKDNIKPKNWELTNETKNIGHYTCYKAIVKDSVYVMRTKKDGTLEEKIKKMTITAWYTPQIPVSNGPREFGGLPGLILEINDGELTLVCTEIVMNPEKRFKIKRPKKGKVISYAKYIEIEKKKRKEALERNKYKRKTKKALSFDDL